MNTVSRKNHNIIPYVITIAGFALLVMLVIVMLRGASKTSEEEGLQAAQDSIVRAIVSCYAYEGFYPDSIEYLTENYNLTIDKSRYLIHYDKAADNLMPNIIITAR